MLNELAHYLKEEYTKGSPEELEHKLMTMKKPTPQKIAALKDRIMCPPLLLYDFECDTEDGTHRPNHVEIIRLKIDEELTHDYDKCFVERLSFTGYDCVDSFCKWLLHERNKGAIIMAHNAAGYDSKFIHTWMIQNKGKRLDKVIRQGSRITYMYCKKFEQHFIDSYNFFMSPLKKLSETYVIDTLKGYFPHHFNTVENQDYIGKLPCPKMFGADRMMPKDYKDFMSWYETFKGQDDWNFKEELVKYCKDDVELLAKAVLAFRKIFYNKLKTDPFSDIKH